jgi:putative membrane protein
VGTEMGKSRPQWTSEHLANERTHLAWLRTGIALVSFGITVNRFSIYLNEQHRSPASHSAWVLVDVEHMGIGMVLLGIILLFYAAFRYEQVRRDIEQRCYHPRQQAILAITLLIILLAGGSLFILFRER